MLCYYFCRNTLSDTPIHTSLYTGSCLVVVCSLHCSIHLFKYSTHVPYIQFIPLSVCHTLHQVLPNHFSSRTSLTFKCIKIWASYFLPSSSYSQFSPPTFLWHTKLNHLTQVFFWQRQWKYITIMYFLTIKFLHFSPNTICEQFNKQQRVKKIFHISQNFKKPTWTEILGS